MKYSQYIALPALSHANPLIQGLVNPAEYICKCMPSALLYLADSRAMPEVPDASVGVVVTSPPYWHIKDYGIEGQIGYGQSLHEYLYDLARVWQEVWRVLMPGRRLCINIGDQFARAEIYGRYSVIPLHAEIIAQALHIGFEYLGAIIWQKKTTLTPSGGAVVMGSFPYPPNGIVELDYEYILIFRKPGKSPVPSLEQREASRLSRDEWKAYFTGHWHFAGERQTGHEAMFPLELPHRLIRMFSFVGETVLDPFAGSGTTLQAAIELGRNAIGYEIQPSFIPLVQQRVGSSLLASLTIHRREMAVALPAPPPAYRPAVADARPSVSPMKASMEMPLARAVQTWIDENGQVWLRIESGEIYSLIGISVAEPMRAAAQAYLRRYIQGKRLLLKSESHMAVYAYLSNRLFVNRKMIEMGLAIPTPQPPHKYQRRFIAAYEKVVVQNKK